MCDACEDWDARDPRRPVMPAHLAGRARGLERLMPGDPVSDSAWRIALGEASGAISWPDHLRILAAFQAAAQAEPAAPFARRPGARRLTCAATG